MPYKKTNNCPICGKPIDPRNKYCQKHKLFTAEHRRNISLAVKGVPKPSLKGKKRPQHSKFLKKWWSEHPEEREKARQRGQALANNPEYLQKLSILLSGKNNPNWKNGLSQRHYKYFYQKLKDKIRKRDNFTCLLCGKTETELGYNLSIHHIDFNKKNYDEQNLCALCKQCNSIINFRRLKWTEYLKNKIVSMYGIGKKGINTELVKYVD